MSNLDKITPLEIPGVSDYHIHPDFSIDASGSVDEFCQAALKRELVEICFTTHFDSNPDSDGNANFIRINGEKKPAEPDNLAPYVEAVRKAHEKFYPMGLSVKLGIEFGWYPGCEEKATTIKEMYGFDYFLCGIHEVGNYCFCCRSEYEKCFSQYENMEEMAEAYFNEVKNAIESGLFDTIAHLDYYKKFGMDFYGSRILEVHEPHLEEIFEMLKNSNTSLEINTSAMLKGLDDYFPSIKIIHQAKKEEVPISHLGSDAHAPNQVGYDFEVAASLQPPFIHDHEG